VKQGALLLGLLVTGSFSIRGSGLRQVIAVKDSSAMSFARLSSNECRIGVMLAGVQRSWTSRGMFQRLVPAAHPPVRSPFVGLSL
jgi:hypothetical protein